MNVEYLVMIIEHVLTNTLRRNYTKMKEKEKRANKTANEE